MENIRKNKCYFEFIENKSEIFINDKFMKEKNR